MNRRAYFTNKNIDRVSLEMLRSLQRRKLVHGNLKINHDRVALLVLDMQKYFFDQKSHAYIPSGQAIIPVINNLIKYFSSLQLPIIFTKHFNEPETAGMMGTWWKELIDRNSSEADLIDEIDATKGTLIYKEHYDAFWNSNLDIMLKDKDVRQVLITGVMTHLCCESTARAAFIRNYQVFFAVDGTATYSQDMHLASLLNLAHGFVKPVLSNEVLGE